MCEIFPEVESCCGVASIRVGMVLIAVLAITTGSLSLSIVEQVSQINYKDVVVVYNNVSNFSGTDPTEMLHKMPSFNVILMAISLVGFIFIIAGVALLFSTLSDQEGFAQLFVWLVFLNIFFGFIILIAVSYECVYGHTVCLFGEMDWLSSASIQVAVVSYLLTWYYFCCVANSYVLNAHV